MYDKRKQEVHSKLDEAVKIMPARETSSLKDQQAIREAITRYFILRQKTMEEAIGFLGSTTKTPEEQRSRWDNHFQTRSAEAIQILKEALKDKRQTLFMTVITEMISEESSFLSNLADLHLADIMQARIIAYKQQFESEKKNLLDKWDDLLSTNKNVNANIRSISEELTVIYKNGLDLLEATHTGLRENLSKALALWAAMDEATPSPPSIFTPISIMVDTLNSFMVNGKDVSYRFEQLYRSEESVTVIMFGNTRKSVKEFLENTNLDKALKEYTETENRSIEVANNMLTKGQREDAQLFVSNATTNTKPGLRAFTDEYNNFVNEFKEIFIGPVGDRTVEDLLQKKQWEEHKNEWQRLNIQDKLKKIYDDSRHWINLDIYKLDPPERKLVENALALDQDRLEKALALASGPTVMNALETFMLVVKNNIADKIKGT